MGRRAKKAPVQTKKRQTLAKRFKCPFCANDEVVECKMDLKAGVGSLACRLCGASYQMPIHHLHEPIDVFSEWLDDCEAAQNPSSTREQHPQQRRYEEEEDDDDDDLGEASGLTRTTQREEEEEPAQKKKSSQPQQQSISTLGLDDSDDDSD